MERSNGPKRTLDKDAYLRDSRYETPKEITKVLAQTALDAGVLKPGSTVADFGCAAGEFLYHLHKQYPDAAYCGYDIVPELIEKARRWVPAANFTVGGVIPIFDNFETAYMNLLHWVRSGGRVYIFDFFNPYPIDAWIRFRPVDHPNPHHRETGQNLFSLASVARFLDKTVGAKNYRFTPFDLPYNAEDPVRAWTFLDADGRRRLTNGLCLLLNFYILEIWV